MADVVECVCLVLLFLVINVNNLELVLANSKAETHPASTEFSKHALVKPRIYHGREKRQISTTKEEGSGHTHHITVDYDLDGESYILDLRLNRELIPQGYFQKYQQDGKHVVNKPTAEETELCHYKGTVRGFPHSWAALSTCNDNIEGVVYDGTDMHYIENNNNDTHYLYRHTDIVPHNKTCGYHGTKDHHHIMENHEFNRILRYKRSAEPMVRGPYNANKQSRYVELVLVVDNREYKELGESRKRVEQHAKNIANIINGLYSPLNIYIALVGVVIWTEYDEIVFSTNGDTTLTNFLHYRREKLIKDHPNDNAQLLTKFVFENGVVGKALKGPICTYEYSGGVNMDHSPVLGLVATTIAHEMGHNFGMEHDTNECTCPEERCIMAPSSSTLPPIHWSSCSLEYLALAFEHGMDYCLRNKPVALFDSPVCGNGFVEPGEQCDCGLSDHCDNTCCNATTCMLHRNASCATGECCDLSTCKPKNAGTLCRSADYECDLPEYCTGQSEYCPKDIYKMDTEACDSGKAYCYHGFCRTRSDQCKLLWGNTGKSSDEQCYKMNTKGTRHGNCGYNQLNKSFFKCQDEHVLCGMLHCKHLNERLEFGMESVAILSHSFINLKGSIIPCRTAIVDLGLNQIDPGLAPDGARCGDGRMCVNQKCMAVDSLQKSVGHCPNNCNGNGLCNSLGHCHCKDGYAPPFCDYPGPGGSSDSGPATDPNAHEGFVRAMFIIFLGIIPLLAIVAFLIYYTKHNLQFTWKKAPSTTKSPQKSRSPTTFSPESPKRIAEDNHSLLSEQSPNVQRQPEFFGQFKGFTLTPIKTNEPEPIRAAPPVPVAPTVPKVIIKKPYMNRTNAVNRAPSFKTNSVTTAMANTNNVSVAPALPPLNPGAHPRPIISGPTLQNSTCTAKELISPLRNAPKIPVRPAPEAPSPEKENKRPVSPEAPEKIIPPTPPPIEEIPFKKPKESTLNRITSFLKSSDKKPVASNSNTPSVNPKKQKNIDKETLRTIEISGPIPQTQIDIDITTSPTADVDETNNKAVVMRAQSMRSNENKNKPKLQSFGSMREPSGLKRPVSITNGVRPKSPPPPRPPENQMEIKKSQNQYDDCLNGAPLAHISEDNSPTSDNIYAVIEETPITSPEIKPNTSSSTSNESFGLLGEIVSEIQNRNFDSIYSTSTLARKKKEEAMKKAAMLDTETYVNAPIYKTPDSVYSNMNKSSASSTSSGYIHPSAVNAPILKKDVAAPKTEVPKVMTKPNLSTFRNDTPPQTKPELITPIPLEIKPEIVPEIGYKPVIARRDGPLSSTLKIASPVSSKKLEPTKTLPSPTSKTPPKLINRQITPPNLRTRKPSPTRTVPTSPKNTQKIIKPTSNSPDLVTSCSTNKTAKGPDVLNTSVIKKPIPAKPNLPKTVAAPIKTNKSAAIVSPPPKNVLTDKKLSETTKPPVAIKVVKSDAGVSKGITTGAKIAAKQQSNVANLQQKFEVKNNIKPVINAKSN